MRQKLIRGKLLRLCDAEVYTYHQRGYHLCYHAAIVVISGQHFCRQHAKAKP